MKWAKSFHEESDPTIERSECVRTTTLSLAESHRRSGILELVAQNANPANHQFDGLSLRCPVSKHPLKPIGIEASSNCHCITVTVTYETLSTYDALLFVSKINRPCAPSAGFNCYVGMKVLYKR